MTNEDRAERLEQASIDAGSEGLKALLILNGGASIAVLGFLATTMSDADANDRFASLLQAMLQSLLAFSAGAGLAVFTSFFAYLANQSYAAALRDNRQSWTRATRQNLTAIVSALLSLICFFVGVGIIWFAGRP